jgi:hypothetical protein
MEESNTTHVLLTRYNLRTAWTDATVTNDAQGWHDDRALIFENICLPSVFGQTHKPDIWLIGFDSSKREYVRRVLDLLSPHPWIVPIWQSSSDGRHETSQRLFERATGSLFGSRHKRIITTRLDNDDAIALNYCAEVRRHATARIKLRPDEQDFWLTFPRGVELCNGAVQPFTRLNNQFLSRCIISDGEPLGDIPTALSGNHAVVLQQSPYVEIDDCQAMFLQFVHRTNAANRGRSRAGPILQAEGALTRFGLTAEVLEFSARLYDPDKLALVRARWAKKRK